MRHQRGYKVLSSRVTSATNVTSILPLAGSASAAVVAKELLRLGTRTFVLPAAGCLSVAEYPLINCSFCRRRDSRCEQDDHSKAGYLVSATPNAGVSATVISEVWFQNSIIGMTMLGTFSAN
jgi:hypothetical protein